MNVNISNPSKRPASRRAGGFTLVELLVVIGIMLLMLKLTLPSIKSLMAGTTGSMARSQLIGDLNRARNMALRNGLPVYVVFMPVLSRIGGTWDQGYFEKDPNDPLKGEANDLLGKQAVAYALYAEKLPGDQPRDPSNHWLTDWKNLPEGFYFTETDLTKISTLAATGVPLTFSHLKNSHSRLLTREMLLPYLMFNGEGELSVRSGNAGVWRNNFFLSVAEGGVFQPAKGTDGFYIYEPADREDSSVLDNKDSVKPRLWLQINSITGRADTWEDELGRGAPPTNHLVELQIIAVTTNPSILNGWIDNWRNVYAPSADLKLDWEPIGWGNPDAQGRRYPTAFVKNPLPVEPNCADCIKYPRHVVIDGIPREKFISFMALLRKVVDPGIVVHTHVK
jgi:type II secretory pathway pseudopilin PulG